MAGKSTGTAKAGKVVTIHVMGTARSLTLKERIMFAPNNRESLNVLWPTVKPEYGKDEDAPARRRRNYFDAVAEVEALIDRVASVVVTGTAIRVNVWPGAILTSDKANGIYANVIGQDHLKELCEFAEDVSVAIDAEDPRDYIGHAS